MYTLALHKVLHSVRTHSEGWVHTMSNNKKSKQGLEFQKAAVSRTLQDFVEWVAQSERNFPLNFHTLSRQVTHIMSRPHERDDFS